MELEFNPCCDSMREYAEDEVFVVYPANHSGLPRPKFEEPRRRPGEHRLVLHTGSVGPVVIVYCPFCGTEITQKIFA